MRIVSFKYRLKKKEWTEDTGSDGRKEGMERKDGKEWKDGKEGKGREGN